MHEFFKLQALYTAILLSADILTSSSRHPALSIYHSLLPARPSQKSQGQDRLPRCSLPPFFCPLQSHTILTSSGMLCSHSGFDDGLLESAISIGCFLQRLFFSPTPSAKCWLVPLLVIMNNSMILHAALLQHWMLCICFLPTSCLLSLPLSAFYERDSVTMCAQYCVGFIVTLDLRQASIFHHQNALPLSNYRFSPKLNLIYSNMQNLEMHSFRYAVLIFISAAVNFLSKAPFCLFFLLLAWKILIWSCHSKSLSCIYQFDFSFYSV